MSLIEINISDNVAFLTFNRPEKFNSFNRPMAFELRATLDECAADENIRAVYLTGAGKAFSAGQDISELTGEKKIEISQILSEHYNPVVQRIRDLEKPVVAAVNGVAAGAGANIALCCDIVVATASASFIQAFSKIGLIPDSGGTYTLPRLIGWQSASALMMTGDKISATEAQQMGMIYKVFPDDTFDNASRQVALDLAQMPTKGLAYTKKILRQSFTNTWEQQLELEDQYQQNAARTADYEEGINAFLEKRKANFKGK